MATPAQLEELLESWFIATDLFGRLPFDQGADIRHRLIPNRHGNANPSVEDVADELLEIARAKGIRLGRFLGSPEGEVYLQVAARLLPPHEAYLAGLIAQALVRAAQLEQAGRHREATPLLVGAGLGAGLLVWALLGPSSN